MRATMLFLRECLGDNHVTTTTSLRRAPGIYCDLDLASFFRFASQTMEKHAPRGVSDRLSEVSLDHVLDLEILVTDDVVLRKQGLGYLTSEV